MQCVQTLFLKYEMLVAIVELLLREAFPTGESTAVDSDIEGAKKFLVKHIKGQE